MDSSMAFLAAGAVILVGGVVIAAKREWDMSDGYEKVFYILIGLALLGLLVYFYWEYFLLAALAIVIVGALLYAALNR